MDLGTRQRQKIKVSNPLNINLTILIICKNDQSIIITTRSSFKSIFIYVKPFLRTVIFKINILITKKLHIVYINTTAVSICILLYIGYELIFNTLSTITMYPNAIIPSL